MSVTTYEQLETIVLPKLVDFHNDLLIHDYNILKNNDSPFVYGYRSNGTDLLLMLPHLPDYAWNKELSIERKRLSLKEKFIEIDYSNIHFLYFDGFKLREKTVTELRDIWFSHIDKIANEAMCLDTAA